ncbi:uncharacterized protein TM35_000141380 [Trypanosoma theileri]|uniref:Uncharacterized protein n=1 Tax=Trypanosoma theileri TaxID=67003 RepID=A0A1X0NW61_9TRYP|nr:uncharacterized protein TM35_000141380 [Trypanosoma theileri]ORC88927.1 hypothetical protein TM35_000141380 [Trypanosoma theileri]
MESNSSEREAAYATHIAEGAGQMTEIPPQFIISKPRKATHDALSHEPHSQVQGEMRNERYEKYAARNAAGARNCHFRVPVNRPLPLRIWDAEAKGHNKKKSNVESVLAPLFSGAASTGNDESVRPGFLIPADQNRRREIEERRRRDEYVRSDQEAKRKMNEPKRMPNLQKKVPRGFVPSCATIEKKPAATPNDENIKGTRSTATKTKR